VSEAKTLVEEFTRILNETLENPSNQGKNRLISYRFELSDTDFERVAHSFLVADDRVFFLVNPGHEYKFVAAGKADGTGDGKEGRFRSAERQSSELRKELSTFYNSPGLDTVKIPLLVGSFSFFNELEEPLWEDFGPADWYVPEFILYSSGTQCIGSYQVVVKPESDVTDLLERFRRYTSPNLSSIPEKPGKITTKLAGTAVVDREKWKKKVADAVNTIRQGIFDKVVLSRVVATDGVEIGQIIPAVLGRSQTAVNSYTFILKSKGSYFFGLSPEKLASFKEGNVYCHAVAGSIRRGDTEDEDRLLGEQLLSSTKNISEHEYVKNHIRHVLEQYCSGLDYDNLPILKKLSYIQHIYTGFRGVVSEPAAMFRIIEGLHPTPAVGGYPVQPALEFINRNEGYDRGLYTGFLGWYDGYGDADFCVALRSALLKDKTMYAFAGGGIVLDSDPDEEFEETEIKLKAIKSLLEN
jgi:menaquinone-specific isochorismate synthase